MFYESSQAEKPLYQWWGKCWHKTCPTAKKAATLLLNFILSAKHYFFINKKTSDTHRNFCIQCNRLQIWQIKLHMSKNHAMKALKENQCVQCEGHCRKYNRCLLIYLKTKLKDWEHDRL